MCVCVGGYYPNNSGEVSEDKKLYSLGSSMANNSVAASIDSSSMREVAWLGANGLASVWKKKHKHTKSTGRIHSTQRTYVIHPTIPPSPRCGRQ